MSKDEEFNQFWAAYPRRIGKGAARKSFDKASKIASHQEIMGGLFAQLPYFRSLDPKFVPHPSTWLNQERWSDEPQQPRQNKQDKRTLRDAAADLAAYYGNVDGFGGV